MAGVGGGEAFADAFDDFRGGAGEAAVDFVEAAFDACDGFDVVEALFEVRDFGFEFGDAGFEFSVCHGGFLEIDS
jgi:hypothetical protein